MTALLSWCFAATLPPLHAIVESGLVAGFFGALNALTARFFMGGRIGRAKALPDSGTVDQPDAAHPPAWSLAIGDMKMNALQNFAFEDHLVRVVERGREPWFVGRDVCECLDIKNASHALSGLDEDEKGIATTDTLGGPQEVIIVSEPGVYRLVFRSRKPEAERFKRWLAHDVLPQIRKHGRYEAAPEPFSVDEASLASIRARVDLVREARAIFGPQRAAALWRTLDLPEAPTMAAISGGDAMDCLNYLLISMADDGRPIGMLLDRAMEDDADAAAMLRLHGIRVVSDMVEVEGFIVSNTAPGVVRLFDGSPWRELGHMKALRRLAGAVATGPMKYDGPRAARGTFIPATYLDAEARH